MAFAQLTCWENCATSKPACVRYRANSITRDSVATSRWRMRTNRGTGSSSPTQGRHQGAPAADLCGHIPTFIRVTDGKVHEVNMLGAIMPEAVP
jgi:hypothetical protein